MQTYGTVPPRNTHVNAEKQRKRRRTPKGLVAGNMKRGRK